MDEMLDNVTEIRTSPERKATLYINKPPQKKKNTKDFAQNSLWSSKKKLLIIGVSRDSAKKIKFFETSHEDGQTFQTFFHSLRCFGKTSAWVPSNTLWTLKDPEF